LPYHQESILDKYAVKYIAYGSDCATCSADPAAGRNSLPIFPPDRETPPSPRSPFYAVRHIRQNIFLFLITFAPLPAGGAFFPKPKCLSSSKKGAGHDHHVRSRESPKDSVGESQNSSFHHVNN
jgi:hypothetical protein